MIYTVFVKKRIDKIVFNSPEEAQEVLLKSVIISNFRLCALDDSKKEIL